MAITTASGDEHTAAAGAPGPSGVARPLLSEPYLVMRSGLNLSCSLDGIRAVAHELKGQGARTVILDRV
jgi:hypothetical protein